MDDAATRFYERNFSASAGIVDPGALDRFIAQTKSGGARYSQAWQYLEAHRGCAVLELGCGSPEIPAFLAPLTESYTAIDIVEGRLGTTSPGNVRSIRANLDNDFPVADSAFDVVLAMMVIEHLYDPFHAFGEIARVTRPGGMIFINLPNIASIRCRIDLLLGRLPHTSNPNWFETGEWDGNHLHYFTVASVRRIAGHFGLSLDAVHPVGRMLGLKRLRPQLFCHEINYVLRKR